MCGRLERFLNTGCRGWRGSSSLSVFPPLFPAGQLSFTLECVNSCVSCFGILSPSCSVSKSPHSIYSSVKWGQLWYLPQDSGDDKEEALHEQASDGVWGDGSVSNGLAV